MGRKAPQICKAHGCGELTLDAYCDACKAKYAEVCDEKRKASHKRYNEKRSDLDKKYGEARWRKLSIVFRRRHPLCCECKKQGKTVLADVVDHIVPTKIAPEKFYDWDNLRSLCHACHNRIGEKVSGD